MIKSCFRIVMFITALCAVFVHGIASSQDRPAPLDVLNLESTVSTEVTPDLAVVSLAVLREGSDVGVLTPDVDQVLAHAIGVAKSVSGLQMASGPMTTVARFDSKGQRTGWQVRAELILKSKDPATLGRLAAKLSSPPASMQIVSLGFEVSPELRSSEESDLMNRAISGFKLKANSAAKNLGYSSFIIREVSVGSVSISGMPRPIAAPRMASSTIADAAPVSLESGRVTLQLGVSGSVLMRH